MRYESTWTNVTINDQQNR